MATRKSAKKKPAAKRTAKKATVPSPPPKKCFVMMPFKAPFDTYYSAIFKPAIESAGMEPVRADDLFRPSVIVSDIWGMIKDGDVLLAELTTKNANVFYELGLAHAVGKPVILVSETMEDVPFDLQQLRVLLYDKDDPSWGGKLSEAIAKSILETLANPVEAVPPIFRKKLENFAPEQDATIARIDSLESQVRLLRSQSSRGLAKRSWRNELEDVNNSSMLDDWFRKWKEVIPTSLLLREIRDASNIPSEEADRIRDEHLKRNAEPQR